MGDWAGLRLGQSVEIHQISDVWSRQFRFALPSSSWSPVISSHNVQENLFNGQVIDLTNREVDVLVRRAADGIEAKLRRGGWSAKVPRDISTGSCIVSEPVRHFVVVLKLQTGGSYAQRSQRRIECKAKLAYDFRPTAIRFWYYGIAKMT